MNKTFRAERGVGRWGRRSGGVMRFFGGSMAEFVRKGHKIKKERITPPHLKNPP